MYRVIANSSLYHCGKKWKVIDENWNTQSEWGTMEKAQEWADILNYKSKYTAYNCITTEKMECDDFKTLFQQAVGCIKTDYWEKITDNEEYGYYFHGGDQDWTIYETATDRLICVITPNYIEYNGSVYNGAIERKNHENH